MHPHLFVPSLTDAQRQSLQHGLRSAAAFTVRRCQIVLASANRTPPSTSARRLGNTTETLEISPLFALDAEELQAKIKGEMRIQGATYLAEA